MPESFQYDVSDTQRFEEEAFKWEGAFCMQAQKRRYHSAVRGA